MVDFGRYCDVSELKGEIDPGNVMGSSYDAILNAKIEAASRAIDALCGRRLFTATETRTYTAEFGDLLFIDDLASLTSLKTDEAGDGTYELTWATTDYILEPANAQVDTSNKRPYTRIRVNPHRGVYSFPTGIYAGVQVVGSFGYAAVTPALISSACLILAAFLYRLKDAPLGAIGGGEIGEAIRVAKQHPVIPGLLAPFVKRQIVAV